ncbi:MAG: DoxX family protein [Bacteroidota bacterium]
MTEKRAKLIYYISTGLLTALTAFSAGMYFVNYEHVSEEFVKLGFPVYIIYPLAILKILGLVAIWTKKSRTLKEWAYAGFFFDFLLAGSAHLYAGDGEFGGAVFATILLLTSYLSWGKND